MKISLVGPVYPYRGGIAHHTTLLARALSGKHELQLISFSSQYPAWLYPGKSDRDPSAQTIQLAAEYLLSSTNPLTWTRTARAIELFQAEAVIFPWWTTFWAPAFGTIAWLLRRKGIKVIYLIHNTLPHEARWFDRSLTRRVLRLGSGFITQAQREQARLQTLLPNARIVSVSHPVYDQFGLKLPKAEARVKLGLPPHKPVILFFGFVRPYKGLSYLIESLAEPTLCNLQPQLIVAGEIWKDKATYVNQIRSLGLEASVKLIDRYIPDEEIPAYFSAADVFAAPYINGSQSGSLKLAFGFGLPVIATDVIADEDVRKIGGALLTTVDPADAKALAAALASAITQNRDEPLQPVDGAESWQTLVKAIEEVL